MALGEFAIHAGHSLNLQHVGIMHDFSNAALTAPAQLRPQFLRDSGLNNRGLKNAALVHKLLGKEFMRDVAPGHESEYALSVAVSEFLMLYEGANGLLDPS